MADIEDIGLLLERPSWDKNFLIWLTWQPAGPPVCANK